MTSQAIEVIKTTLQNFEDNDFKFVEKIGKFKEKISNGVLKYSAFDPMITHFLIFENAGAIDEISFYCENIEFSLKELKNILGPYEQGYNFRENYSQFTFSQEAKNIKNIFFIKDNKFLFEGNDRIVEVTPQGNACSHSDIFFNAFCINIKNSSIEVKSD